MKLIIAVISREDTEKTLASITEAGFRATKLASTGGFLKTGNTTLLLGVEDERLDELKNIFTDKSGRRKKTTSPILHTGESVVTPLIETYTGGATLFVLDVGEIVHL